MIAGAVATRFSYDSQGRRLKRRLPGATGGLQSESWDYDYAQGGDSPPADKRMNKVRHTDFLGHETVTAYDMMGRVDLKQEWTGSQWRTLVDFDYTPRGQRWKMKDPFTASISQDAFVEYHMMSWDGWKQSGSPWCYELFWRHSFA